MATTKTAKKATTKTSATKSTKTAKKVTLTTAPAKTAKTAKTADAGEKGTRGRKIGSIGFKWVKAPKEPWPSVLECNIMDACEAVEQGTSGDVTAYALKHGLNDLTKQIPNKVVTHVMVKLRKAGIITGNDTLKKSAKSPAVAEKVTPVAKKAKKAKKSRVVMESAPAADVQDTPATA